MYSQCEIEFENNPGKIVYAGQLLRGTVRLNLTDYTTIRGVYIHKKGKANASWRVGKTHVSAKENYLDAKVYLVQPSTGMYFG